MQVLSGAAVSRLQLVEPRGKPLGAPSHRAVGLVALWHLVFLLGDPASSHFRASAHFLSVMPRLRFARDRGREVERVGQARGGG